MFCCFYSLPLSVHKCVGCINRYLHRRVFADLDNAFVHTSNKVILTFNWFTQPFAALLGSIANKGILIVSLCPSLCYGGFIQRHTDYITVHLFIILGIQYKPSSVREGRPTMMITLISIVVTEHYHERVTTRFCPFFLYLYCVVINIRIQK